MPFGFYIIMAAQFFSSLADNALLVAAIAALTLLDSPAWLTPMLKLFFVISYVVLAPVVGAFADALPKGHVMFISNAIKVAGCLMMLLGVHPLPANGWVEGPPVASIILGTVLGGVLISQALSAKLLRIDIPQLDTGIDTAPEIAIAVIIVFYVIAAVFNLYIPRTGIA